MRHVGTLIAAIVIAPLAWILLAMGQDRSMAAFADAQRAGFFHNGDFVRPLQYLAAAGLLLGLVATLRFSPLGTLFTGVVYMSSYTLLLVVPTWPRNALGDDLSVAGYHADPTTPIRTGTTLVLGTLLLAATVSFGRSRRRRRPVADAFGTTLEQDHPLGADGLGLTPPDRRAEPQLTGGYTTRYATRAEPAPW
jgi:hypothetical protein